MEKPVLFDVTEHNHRNCQQSLQLEKPVLFDVTEQIHFWIKNWLFGWKSRFYLMSRNKEELPENAAAIALEKPVLFDVTELSFICSYILPPRWKSRFYLMSRNITFAVSIIIIKIGWKSRFYLMSRNSRIFFLDASIALEKPVLFDVTERFRSGIIFTMIVVGKAGFIWCHGTVASLLTDNNRTVGKAGFIWCHGTYH